VGSFALVDFGQLPVISRPGDTALNHPALSMDKKASFLSQHAGRHLRLGTAPRQVLVNALAKASIHEYDL
jgi:hypothetical protein